MEENVRRGDNRKWNATTTAKSCLKKGEEKPQAKRWHFINGREREGQKERELEGEANTRGR